VESSAYISKLDLGKVSVHPLKNGAAWARVPFKDSAQESYSLRIDCNNLNQCNGFIKGISELRVDNGPSRNEQKQDQRVRQDLEAERKEADRKEAERKREEGREAQRKYLDALKELSRVKDEINFLKDMYRQDMELQKDYARMWREYRDTDYRDRAEGYDRKNQQTAIRIGEKGAEEDRLKDQVDSLLWECRSLGSCH
jgi:hypothetical protein